MTRAMSEPTDPNRPAAESSASLSTRGPQAAATYPMSRLAPAFQLVDVAKQIEEADHLLGAVTSGKLHTILEQVRALQRQAEAVLAETQKSAELHRVACQAKKRPGATYHLYEKPDGSRYFSLLSPEEWGTPPHSFVGSYRLELDQSFTPVERIVEREADARAVTRLLGWSGAR
jgi:hypothetical protein